MNEKFRTIGLDTEDKITEFIDYIDDLEDTEEIKSDVYGFFEEESSYNENHIPAYVVMTKYKGKYIVWVEDQCCDFAISYPPYNLCDIFSTYDEANEYYKSLAHSGIKPLSEQVEECKSQLIDEVDLRVSTMVPNVLNIKVWYKNCFRKSGNSTYYLQANGTMAKGRLKVKGSWYSFNRNTGQLVRSGWYKETDGSYYYAASNGKLVKGFYKPDSYYRYFRKSDCKLVTGWQTINGHKYYFKKTNGIRYDDIILKSSSGKRYYFESDGKLASSKWITKKSAHYYAKSDGVLASGWLTVDGKKYYMNPSTCERESGWVTVEKYYLSSSTGALVTNQWIDDNHYVGEDGSLIPDYQNGVSFRWPLSSGYSYISSYFGNRESPGGIGSTNHKGIDIPAPTGTPIYAAASGTIVAMLSPAASGGAGYYTKINHDGKGLITEYMHQSKFNPNLSVGDKVKKGDIIGYVGSTGNSTGPHLHFGVMVNGVNQNPLNYVKRPS